MHQIWGERQAVEAQKALATNSSNFLKRRVDVVSLPQEIIYLKIMFFKLKKFMYPRQKSDKIFILF